MISLNYRTQKIKEILIFAAIFRASGRFLCISCPFWQAAGQIRTKNPEKIEKMLD